ncbi:MAG: hypothetical protein ACOVJ5_01270 [Gloeomargaritales cyanobacterium]
MKVCTKCKVEKSLNDFSKNKNRIDNFEGQCKKCRKEYLKQYYLDNSDKIKENQKQYDLVNEYKIIQYRLSNKDKNNTREKNRKLVDPLYKLSGNIRSLIGICVKNQGYKKTSKTSQILGCSFEDLKNHLENQFTEGMTWNNYGKWELDHIYPVSRATDEEHLIILNHYTNFQPLWKEDNRSKSNKLDYQVVRK